MIGLLRFLPALGLAAAVGWAGWQYLRAERAETALAAAELALASEREAARFARAARDVAIEEARRAETRAAGFRAIRARLRDDPDANDPAPAYLLRSACTLGLRPAADCGAQAGGD